MTRSLWLPMESKLEGQERKQDQRRSLQSSRQEVIMARINLVVVEEKRIGSIQNRLLREN